MKKIALMIALIILSSCTYSTSTDYQNVPPRDLVIQWKNYKVTNINLCDRNCNVWIVYPADWTWWISLSNNFTSWKTTVNNSTIIIP